MGGSHGNRIMSRSPNQIRLDRAINAIYARAPASHPLHRGCPWEKMWKLATPSERFAVCLARAALGSDAHDANTMHALMYTGHEYSGRQRTLASHNFSIAEYHEAFDE